MAFLSQPPPEIDPLTVTIFHNPACGTSRNTLAMIRASGEVPVVIDYLSAPPSRERLIGLVAAMEIPVHALLREKGRLMPSSASAIRNGRTRS